MNLRGRKLQTIVMDESVIHSPSPYLTNKFLIIYSAIILFLSIVMVIVYVYRRNRKGRIIISDSAPQYPTQNRVSTEQRRKSFVQEQKLKYKEREIKLKENEVKNLNVTTSPIASEETSLLDESVYEKETEDLQFKTDKAALLNTFKDVLREGLILNLHSQDTKKKVREVKFQLIGDQIQWRTFNSTFSSKKAKKMNLSEVVKLEAGKKTEGFKGKDVADDRCFSLISDKEILDLETSSKVERDALLYGFSIEVHSLLGHYV